MKKALLIGVVLWLAATGAAWASGQVDEPPPGQPPSTQTPEETPDGGVALGVYLSAGKSLYAYDFARLNHTLGVGGAGTFAQYIDDWEFELVFAATQLGFFGFGGGFWSQHAGGPRFDSTLDGWQVMVRWGMALADNDRLQLYPDFGVGYAQHSLTMNGDLSGLDLGGLPSRGNVEVKQYGLMLEAGLRVDFYHGAPQQSAVAFLLANSLTLGWQGMPWHSRWHYGSHSIDAPNDLNSAFFVRFSIGFGLGVRGGG